MRVNRRRSDRESVRRMASYFVGSAHQNVGVTSCTKRTYDGHVMLERPILCPQCFDSMLQPVEGVKLIALHTLGLQIVSPAVVYQCGQHHIFAVFGNGTQVEPELPQRAIDGLRAM
jgi:hypothetical protein